jgi:hypothetical protein
LPAGETIILDSRIKNITAIVNGEENTAWTADKKASFYLGSLSDLKTMFGMEHNMDGTHRARVIKLPYMKIGQEEDALRGSVLPLGIDYQVNEDGWNKTDDVALSLRNESIIRARDDASEAVIRFAKDLELENRINQLEAHVIDCTGKMGILWDAIFADMSSNPFLFTFADLNGITLIRGVWDQAQQLLSCTAVERTIKFTFANLDTITLVHGVWHKNLVRLEC